MQGQGRNGWRRGLAACVAAAGLCLGSMAAAQSWSARVTGVAEPDMLKLRAGPGTGFRVIVGLPNGTELRVHGCERLGGTRWCEVSLEEVRQLRGHVSESYLTKP